MAKTLQFRRGTTAQNNSFTGAQGELTVDLQANNLRIHDGTTLGGFPIREDVSWDDVSAKPTTLAGFGITDAQAEAPNVTALAAITGAADQLVYFTAAETLATATLSGFGRSLIDDADAATARTTLGLPTNIVTSVATGTGLTGGPVTATGTISLADTAVAPAAYGSATQVGTFTVDQQGRITTAGNVTVTPAWASITSKPTTLAGFGITDAQAVDPTLTALAGVATAADRVPYFTGTDAAAVATLTAFGRSLIDDADAAAARTTLGLDDDDAVQFGNLSVNNLTVNGTTTTVNSTTTTIDDPILTLGGDTAPTVDDNKDRGIEFRYHNGTAAQVGFFGYDDSDGRFKLYTAATNTNEVFAGTVGDIQATTFYGALSGNATTATTASAAPWAGITDKPTTLAGFGITDAQAADPTLAAMAGVTTAADRMIYFTGADAAAATPLTAFGRSLIDDADVTAARTTLGLGTAATAATGTSGATIPLLNAVNTWSGGQTFTNTTTIANNSPTLVFSETDQTLPAGLWRWNGSAGGIFLQRNTAVAGDFTTAGTELSFDLAGVATFRVTPKVGTTTLPLPNVAQTWTAIQTMSGTSPAVGDGQLYITGSETTGAIDTGGGLLFLGHDGAIARALATVQGMKENATVGNYASYLRFGTRANAGNIAERMRIDSAGYVGIGTTAPQTRLDVTGASASTTGISGPSALTLTNANTTANNLAQVVFSTVDTLGATIGTSTIATVFTSHTAGAVNADLTFSTRAAGNYSEKVRLLANGNFGIGTAAPSRALTVQSTGQFDPTAVTSTADTLHLIQSGGTQGAGAYGASISFSKAGSTTRAAAIAPVQFATDPDQTGLAFFFHGGTGTNDALSEGMRLDAAGRLAVGTTDPRGRFHVAAPSVNFVLDETDAAAENKLWDLIADASAFSIRAVNDAYTAAEAAITVNRSAATVTQTTFPNGRIGLGKTPEANFRLHVAALGSAAARFSTNDFTVGGTGSELTIGFGATTGNTYSALTAMSHGEAAYNNLVLQNGGGNVGIGTAAPIELLHVHNATASAVSGAVFTNGTSGTTTADGLLIGLRADNHAQVWSRDNNNLHFATNNTERLRVLSTGNVEVVSNDLNMVAGVLRKAGVQVVGARDTGWTAATGTGTKTTFATGTVTLAQLAERVKAIMDALIAHGLIGA